ncbi:hypothetical protein B1693_10230 [Geobacillus zalihae]|nr:hypothetical protein B1693_10230 [Geobacillus zalihae]
MKMILKIVGMAHIYQTEDKLKPLLNTNEKKSLKKIFLRKKLLRETKRWLFQSPLCLFFIYSFLVPDFFVTQKKSWYPTLFCTKCKIERKNAGFIVSQYPTFL